MTLSQFKTAEKIIINTDYVNYSIDDIAKAYNKISDKKDVYFQFEEALSLYVKKETFDKMYEILLNDLKAEVSQLEKQLEEI